MLPQVDHPAVEEFWLSDRSVGSTVKELDEYADPICVPQLVIRDGQRCLLFEPLELDEFAWDLEQCDPTIAEDEFSIDLNIGGRVQIAVNEEGGVRIGGVQEVIARQLNFWAEGDDWSKVEFVSWLDREIHHGGSMAGLPKSESQAWVLRTVDSLLVARKADLRILVRKRHDLARLLITRLSDHGRQQVRKAAESLFDNRAPRRLETSMDAAMVLKEENYTPIHRYHGIYDLSRHAFRNNIGEMGKDEEPECAKRINDHPNVKRWVRNLSSESAGGFSLPLAPGRFFPDFIAELLDGRLAIIEYKGKDRMKLEEELHKKDVGELWQARSDGQCVFIWVANQDWDTLKAGLAAIT